jgi:hypothetical protein
MLFSIWVLSITANSLIGSLARRHETETAIPIKVHNGRYDPGQQYPIKRGARSIGMPVVNCVSGEGVPGKPQPV